VDRHTQGGLSSKEALSPGCPSRKKSGPLNGAFGRMSEEKKPHFTLSPAFKIAGMAVYGTCALGAAYICHPTPHLVVALGLVVGLACGLMQRAAVDNRPGAFAGARSMAEIRRGFTHSTWGKRYLLLQWCSTGLLVYLSLFLYDNIMLAVVGFFCIMTARDLATIRPTGVLPRASE
jgi:hypothetical protein